MNWKYTALVSGATLVATWFASTPAPQHTAAPGGGTTAPTTGVSRASEEAAREADRLSARVHSDIPYEEPSRNLFRFAQPRREAARRVAPEEPEITDEPMTGEPAGPSLRVTLSGIAEDTVGGTTVRTAVISTPDDVLLVKEGDAIAGQYKVTAVTANSVELTRESDGSVVRLTLRP